MFKTRSTIPLVLAVGATALLLQLPGSGDGAADPRAGSGPQASTAGPGTTYPVSIYIGEGEHWEQPQWNSEQTDWGPSGGQIRICGPVGGMVQLLMDAWLVNPRDLIDWDPEKQEMLDRAALYDGLVQTFPELDREGVTGMGTYGLPGLPDLQVGRTVFETSAAVPLLPGPGGVPSPTTALYYYQPIVGTGPEGCRLWDAMPYHWQSGTPGEGTLQLWKGVASASGTDTTYLLYEFLWQLALTVEGGSTVMSSQYGLPSHSIPSLPVYEHALDLGLGITIQPLVYTSPMIDPGTFISEPVPGLVGVEDPNVIEISLGDPISFGVSIHHPATSICPVPPCPVPPPFITKLPTYAIAGRPVCLQVTAGVPGATTLRLIDGVTGTPHDITLSLLAPGRYCGMVPNALGGSMAIWDRITTAFGATVFNPQSPPITIGVPPGG